MLYFAYGSNLDWAQMKQRCPLAKFVCRAKLPAHRLAFTLKSARRDCGVADVLPDQAKDVWCRLRTLGQRIKKPRQKRRLSTRKALRPERVHSRRSLRLA